jgi:hypothetical protein
MSVTLETPVGYVIANDVYVSYSEYYGDGTIYGYTEILSSDGNPVKGAGKTKVDLINENAMLGNNLGSVTGDIIAVLQAPEAEAVVPEVVPEPVVPEAAEAEAVVPEAEAVVPEAEAVVPEAAEVVPEAAEVVPEVVQEVVQSIDDNRYTVSFSFMGFDITREFSAKIDVEGRKIYLS